MNEQNTNPELDSNEEDETPECSEEDLKAAIANVQAHHGLVDGLHLGKFYEIFSQKIIDFSDSQF